MSTKLAIILLLAANVLFGIAHGLLSRSNAGGNALQIIQLVTLAAIIYYWALLDARAQSRTLGPVQGICIFVFGYLAVPFYLASSRPKETWPNWLSKGVAVFACCTLAFLLPFALAGSVSA